MSNESLRVLIGADKSAFVKAMAETVQASKAAQEKMAADSRRERAKSAAETREHFAGAGKEMLAAAGISLTIGALVEATKASIEFASHIGDVSDSLGVSSDQMQTLGYAFSQSGVNQETFEKGLTKLTVSMAEARDGNDDLVQKFARLGVTWEDLHRMSPDEVLLKIAKGAEGAGDSTERLGLYMALLGKAGSKMAAGLNEGADAIKKLQGNISPLSKEDISTLKEGSDAMDTLWTKAKLFGAKVASGGEKWINQIVDPQATAKEIAKEREDSINPKTFKTPSAPSEVSPFATDEVQEKAAEEQRTIAEHEAAEPSGNEKSIPTDRVTKKILNQEADESLVPVFGSIKTAQGNADNDADNDAENAERKTEEEKQIADIKAQSDYARMASTAEILRKTSQIAAIDKEDALYAKQKTDYEALRDKESDPVKKEAIIKNIAGIEDKQKATAEKRADLEERIALASEEIGFAEAESAIAREKSLGMAMQTKAIDDEIALTHAKIASNMNQMRTADELRTAELKKQNVELSNQITNLGNIKRSQFVTRHLQTPQEQNAAAAAERRRQQLERQSDREDERKRRKGHAIEDAPGPSLGEQLKPRMHGIGAPVHGATPGAGGKVDVTPPAGAHGEAGKGVNLANIEAKLDSLITET